MPDSVACPLVPMLWVRRCTEAVAFYRAALGTLEAYRVEDPDGAVVARLTVGGAAFWVSDEASAYGNPSPAALGGASARLILTVPDPDAAVDQAVSCRGRPELDSLARPRHL